MDELRQFRRQWAQQRRRERSIDSLMILVLPLFPLILSFHVGLWLLAMVAAKAFELCATVLRRAQDRRGHASSTGFLMALEIAADNLRHRFVGEFGITRSEPTQHQRSNKNQRELVRSGKKGTRVQRFLSAAGFFLPREMREPFWEHLVEDCARMRKEGRSGLFVTVAMISQFMLLVANFLKETLLDLAVGAIRSSRNP